jgi:hypothetical protein
MSVLTRLSCLVFLLALPEMGLAVAPPSLGNVLEEFAFSREGGPIIVPVTIRGKSYPFIVDTGCTVSVLDESLRPMLGRAAESVDADTPIGRIEAVLVKPSAFIRVGSLQLIAKNGVIVHDFRRIREEHGVQMWGYLGMDFLAKHVVRIDFDKGRIAFLRSVKGTVGHRIPMMMTPSTHDIPCVECRIPSERAPQWFMVDTGAVGQTSGSLRGETFRRLEQSGKLRPAGHLKATTAAGTMDNSIGRLTSLSMGPFKLPGLYFSDGGDADEHRLDLGFWSRYQVTFDFPGKAVYLNKGRCYADPDGIDGSGLSILLHKGLAMVEVVAPNSPAAKAGIRKGDQVVSIAGRKAAGANLVVLRRLLWGEGRTVRLVVRRGEEKREVPLRLELAWRTETMKR